MVYSTGGHPPRMPPFALPFRTPHDYDHNSSPRTHTRPNSALQHFNLMTHNWGNVKFFMPTTPYCTPPPQLTSGYSCATWKSSPRHMGCGLNRSKCVVLAQVPIPPLLFIYGTAMPAGGLRHVSRSGIASHWGGRDRSPHSQRRGGRGTK